MNRPNISQKKQAQAGFLKAILRFTVQILEFEGVRTKPMSPYWIHDAGLDQNRKIGFNLLFLTFYCITNESP